ncbi:2-oxo-4-hydroxy-4-carboxy-5-ureidoimidazoline decarboxylase [Paenibacillus hexagrammi]|uniref:2-oxo-4-hydroxy-4-carboxy-5-ureidoimidazoline decarboxylase n=1 Tax=Paenibacillus hexagrammi TaxID=2908839 RepID=UPI0021A8FD58|nr:2-oxo-4-hydroxy-4-carboxy-5-ureidoimidazoline decarboxylase [Paenibacillus sp. YPD9-1]
MAVKGQTKESIFVAIRTRVEGVWEEEKTRALQEVCKIGRFRLSDVVHVTEGEAAET